jgi:hypothetical protein
VIIFERPVNFEFFNNQASDGQRSFFLHAPSGLGGFDREHAQRVSPANPPVKTIRQRRRNSPCHFPGSRLAPTP